VPDWPAAASVLLTADNCVPAQHIDNACCTTQERFFREQHAKIFEDADPLSYINADPRRQRELTSQLHSDIMRANIGKDQEGRPAVGADLDDESLDEDSAPGAGSAAAVGVRLPRHMQHRVAAFGAARRAHAAFRLTHMLAPGRRRACRAASLRHAPRDEVGTLPQAVAAQRAAARLGPARRACGAPAPQA
jgi:hypothetical protein